METLWPLILTQVIIGAGTVAAIKTDMNWIKKTIDQHNKRITFLERKDCNGKN